MVSWDSICFMVSRATPTTMRIEVPPNGNVCGSSSHTANTMEGTRAIVARNIEHGRVIRLRMRCRYSDVGFPGRMPGMNPAYLRQLSAVSTGLNEIAV